MTPYATTSYALLLPISPFPSSCRALFKTPIHRYTHPTP